MPNDIMPDIFISYSHKNIDFARKLHAKLSQSNYDVWIDFEDIPYSVDWMEEIKIGIINSASIIVIISAESLTSKICTLEVEYARRNNKRIIPIILQDIKMATLEPYLQAQTWHLIAKENWELLQSLNWLFFREQDNFVDSYQALQNTILKDPELVLSLQ